MSDPLAARTILLGAGASKPANIPMSVELLEEVFDPPRLRRSGSLVLPALNAALGGLKFASPRKGIDVEDLYQTLRELSLRDKHPLAPFVGTWHEFVTRAERIPTDGAAVAVGAALHDDLDSYVGDVRSAISQAIARSSRTVPKRSLRLDSFTRALRRALRASGAERIDTYQLAANYVLGVLFEKCWIPDARSKDVDYLHPLLRSARDRQLRIATLNYDNTLEIAARSVGLALEIGVRPSSASVIFEPAAKCSVAKLHGSLDWMQLSDGKLEISSNPVNSGSQSVPALVFGNGNKLRISGPYLDLLLTFRAWLAQTDLLEVCGYSFRDVHINYLIYSWLEEKPSRHVSVSDPTLDESKLRLHFDATIAQALSEVLVLDPPMGGRLKPDWYKTRFTLGTRGVTEFSASFAV